MLTRGSKFYDCSRKIQDRRIGKGLTKERLAEMFEVSTDTILLLNTDEEVINRSPLHLGSIYLVVKDFKKSVAFMNSFLVSVFLNVVVAEISLWTGF